ncbi:MAG: GspH/FimT family pseudopilin [Mariprofundaceae bacterium]|nr:GspH/FimT family pseudopilin [Mariprofundaceae bacterium]
MRIGQSLRRSHSARQEAGYDSARGFTLFEVIIVVAIIGIVSAVAIPTFSEWRARSAVDNASKTLLAHLKQARVMAMAENRSVSITFTSSSYTFDADLSGNCGLCKSRVVPFSEFSKNLNISKNDQAVVAATQTFKSRGTTGANTVYFCLQGFTKRISINIIGRAYLCMPTDTNNSCTKPYTCT